MGMVLATLRANYRKTDDGWVEDLAEESNSFRSEEEDPQLETDYQHSHVSGNRLQIHESHTKNTMDQIASEQERGRSERD